MLFSGTPVRPAEPPCTVKHQYARSPGFGAEPRSVHCNTLLGGSPDALLAVMKGQHEDRIHEKDPPGGETE